MFGQEAAAYLRPRVEACHVILLLDACHRALWALEDEARSRLANDATIARIKRSIDQRNGERHRLIDRIDQHADARISCESTPLRPYSETIGEMCDRLLIINLKIENLDKLQNDADLPISDRESCAAQVARFRSWRTHLHACLALILVDLRDGTAMLPPRAERKLYNEATLNPVTRAEAQLASG